MEIRDLKKKIMTGTGGYVSGFKQHWVVTLGKQLFHRVLGFPPAKWKLTPGPQSFHLETFSPFPP